MKYPVKLKTTVYAWAEVEINETPEMMHLVARGQADLREWAADDAVDLHAHALSEPLDVVGLEHGPVELAYEELDESVEVVE